MEADKCQDDFNMSEQLESGMEKTVVSETEEQEKPMAAVEEPEQVAVNGHHEAERSPVNEKPTDDVPESAMPSEEKPPETKPEETLLMDVSEKVEEPVGTEAPSAAVPDQPQPEGPPEKVSEAPAQETPPAVTEKVEEPVAAEERSEVVPAQPRPDEPTETVSPSGDITMGTESENLQLEPKVQPAVESVPEPKVEEPVPEQTSPEPDRVVDKLVEKAAHEEEMAAATVEAVMDTAMEQVAVEKASTVEPPKEKAAEEVLGKPVEVQMESPAASESVKDVPSEAPLQTEAVQSAEVLNTVEAGAVKEGEPQKPAEPESSAAAAAMDPVEQKEANVDQMEPTKEEEEAAAPTVPIPGSLAFALLENEQTKVALRTSRTLIVLRGLPGSGKSFLACAIAESYQNLCSVVSSDDHDLTSADGYKALDEAVITCCTGATGPSVVVVDDTNHTHDRLARLAEIAEQNHRVVLFLEPRTEWCQDLPQLVKRTGRGLEEAQIQAMIGVYEKVSIPLFYGWFLFQDKIKCTAMDFLKTLDSLDAFKKHLADFPVETEKEVDLEQYFHSSWSLHCTTKFCAYGKAQGAKEYAEKTAVQESYGSVWELSLTALFVTPRTVGARVSLTEAQLALWPADADKEAEAAVPGATALPPGSRAHISLGCAEKVEPVQTGLDLLDILVLQQAGQQGELVEEMELGSLVYFDKGRWLLTLREPVSVKACFSSVYKPQEADATKKEPEKKKKSKCSIL